MANTSNIVSFDNEPLMLVDSNDVVIGFEEKAAAHRGNGVLHRAFSIFLFNFKYTSFKFQKRNFRILY